MSEFVSEEGQFSVCQFFQNDTYEYVLRFVSAEAAMKQVVRLTNSVGGKIGTTNRVIITDGGDSCCFDWRFGVGVVFPIVRPEGGTDGTSR